MQDFSDDEFTAKCEKRVRWLLGTPDGQPLPAHSVTPAVWTAAALIEIGALLAARPS